MRMHLLEAKFGDPECVVTGRDPAAAVYLESLAPGSRRTMAAALDSCARLVAGADHANEFSWARVRYEDVVALRAKLGAQYRATTANKMLSAVRGAIRAAGMLGLTDPVMSARNASIRSVRGRQLPRGRCLPVVELKQMLESCDSASVTGLRDRALLMVTFGCGLRRSEVVGLDVSSFRRGDGALVIHGKGNVERLACLPEDAVHALDSWLAVRALEPGAMFLPITRGGRLLRRRLTDQAIYDLFHRMAHRAGIEALSPHDIRRTFITTLLDQGVDLSTVQRMAGHAQVTTTTRYDRRGLEAQRRAVQLLRFGPV
jgi:site-specific recombinase XerD